MSNPPNDEEIFVSRAIVQSLQCDGTPGASVNHTSNPYVYGLVGSFDMLKMAERVIDSLDRYRENVRIGREKLAADEAARLAAVAKVKNV